MATVTKDSRAKIYTSMGDMTLEFLVDKAPRTVENFVNLAHKGFYDGLTFHRVIKDFIIQGGCKNGDGTSKPDYTIRPEFNDTPHVKGVVSMARNNDPHSAFSQFFICHGESRYLDSRYTAFAKVVEGLEIVDKIAECPTDVETRFNEKSVPRTPVYINRIELDGIEFEPEPAVRKDRDEGGSSAPADDDGEGDGEGDGDGEGRRKRSRRGGRGRRRKGEDDGGDQEQAEAAASDDAPGKSDAPDKAEQAASDEEAAPKRTRKKAAAKADDDKADDAKADDDGESDDKPKAKKKTTRRRKPKADEADEE